MAYICEALLVPFSEDGKTGYEVQVEALDISFRCTGGLDQAAEKAAEQVRGALLRCLTLGQKLPPSKLGSTIPEGAERLVLVVDASLPKEDLLPFSEVMHILQVTQPRISHLIKDGRLVAVKEGRNTLITRASLEEYLSTPSNLGRPRKVGGKEKGRP